MDGLELPQGLTGADDVRLFHSVSETAVMIAFSRTFTDIAYSQEMYEALIKHGADPKWARTSPMAPRFEARFLLVDQLLREFGPTQVLEVAAGFSTRGMSWAQADQTLRYVELDTDAVIPDKALIVKEIGGDMPGLSYEAGSVLVGEDMWHATRQFNPHQPLAIINEGLMIYLTPQQQEIFARNVHALLRKFGGVWITPDTLFQEALDRQDAMAQGMLANVTASTGKNIRANAFADMEEARAFYRRCGFAIREVPFTTVTDQLRSPDRLGIPDENVLALNELAVAFELTVA